MNASQNQTAVQNVSQQSGDYVAYEQDESVGPNQSMRSLSHNNVNITPRYQILQDPVALPAPSIGSSTSHQSTHRRLSIIPEGDGKSPIYTAIFNMLAGCGIVGLPVTYKNSGLALGIILMVFVAFISVYTLRLLVETGKKTGVEDYERLTEKCFGTPGYYLLAITILVFDIGACLTYSIILGDSAHSVMSHLFGWNAPEDRKFVVLGAYVILILPFCIGKSHAFIEKISAGAIFSVVIMIAVVVYEYYMTYMEKDVPGVKLINNNSQQVLSALGTISFAFVQHDQAFLVYKTLYHNTIKRYTILSSYAFAIQGFLCINIGVFGYLSFGSETESDVLQNYGMHKPLIITIRIMYTLTMAFIFPTAFYVVRHIIYALIYFQNGEEDTFARANCGKRMIFTFGTWGFFLGLALFITDLGFVMSLSGLLAALLIGFILPCACHLKCSDYPWFFWNAKSGEKWNALVDIVPSIVLVIFGTASGIIGTVQLFIAQF